MKNIDWKWTAIIVLLLGFIVSGIVQSNQNYDLKMKQIETCRDSIAK